MRNYINAKDLVIGQSYLDRRGKKVFFLGTLATFVPIIYRKGNSLFIEYEHTPTTFYIFSGNTLYSRCYRINDIPKLRLGDECLSQLEIYDKLKAFVCCHGWEDTTNSVKQLCTIIPISEYSIKLICKESIDETFFLEFCKKRHIDEYSSFFCWFEDEFQACSNQLWFLDSKCLIRYLNI